MRRLVDESRRGNLQLIVPEIVLREAANLWAELVLKEVAAHRHSLRILGQAKLIDSDQVLTADGPTVRSEEEERIRELVAGANGVIAPLPEISQSHVIERALRRAQPFDPNGRNGYRDVIVWETMLALDPDGGPIVLIAKDKRAFFEDSKLEKGLAASLASEAEQRFGAEQLELHHDLGEGIAAALAKAEEQERIAAQREADDAARARLNDLLSTDFGFAALVTDAVGEALNFWDLGFDLRDYGVVDGEVDSAYIEVVESFNRSDFGDTHVAEDGEVLVEFRSDIGAIAHATMHPSTAVLLEEDPLVSVGKQGFESGVAEAQIEIAARIRADLVIDLEKNGQIKSLATISAFEPLPPQDFLGTPEPTTDSS